VTGVRGSGVRVNCHGSSTICLDCSPLTAIPQGVLQKSPRCGFAGTPVGSTTSSSTTSSVNSSDGSERIQPYRKLKEQIRLSGTMPRRCPRL